MQGLPFVALTEDTSNEIPSDKEIRIPIATMSMRWRAASQPQCSQRMAKSALHCELVRSPNASESVSN
jgi:hypothetical protein